MFLFFKTETSWWSLMQPFKNPVVGWTIPALLEKDAAADRAYLGRYHRDELKKNGSHSDHVALARIEELVEVLRQGIIPALGRLYPL